LTMQAGSRLKVAGASNFPSSFSTRTLNATSIVEYNAVSSTDQTVSSGAYANLVLTNATGSGTSVKTANGNLTIAGDVTVNGFATLALSTFTANRSAAGG